MNNANYFADYRMLYYIKKVVYKLEETYAAHIRDDGVIQNIMDHLEGTASLARSFADAFNCGDYGYVCGKLHDIGKYSRKFQERIRGANLRVDHSAAGAIEINKAMKNLGWLISYCIAGHHTGLPNGGSMVDTGDDPTLCGRLKRSNIPLYSDFEKNINIKSLIPELPPPIRVLEKSGFSIAFYVRMLFSCLVDADFLDTEAFMSENKRRRNECYNMDVLYGSLYKKIAMFKEPISNINKKRNEILYCCLEKALMAKGLFTLTVPTGGGKTISSLAFALRHAITHKMRRIIYVIPYTSIIEQNASVFKEIVGAENVLEHHSNINYDDENEDMSYYRYATENWDMPIIVTTNVQFFESLYANRTSKCRKLHNITNSVIIFDEAQMLPTEYLLPCIRSISELVYNYNCTAVLCSATQPALRNLFPNELTIKEICDNTTELYEFFKRSKIKFVGQLDDKQLSERINEHKQALCIVNTRSQAQNVYKLLYPNGRYHLSTLMCPIHRSKILDEIRNRLKANQPCRVISTSLIEAGVDVDFPVVFREMAGLDSQIQAAGRCNREGRYPKEQSNVNIFEASEEHKKRRPAAMHRPMEIARSIMRLHTDVSSPEAIQDYFEQLYYMEGEGLDVKGIVERLEDGAAYKLSFPFAQIGKDFKLIEETTRSIIIPNDECVKAYIQRLYAGDRSRSLLRKIQPYMVCIYQRDFEKLFGSGQIEPLDNEIAVLVNIERYNEHIGLDIIVESGAGIFC